MQRKDSDPVVQNGLAVTPQRMLELAEDGFAIGAQNSLNLTFEQRRDMDMSIPPERCRGFDIADGFQMQQEVRSKVKRIKAAEKARAAVKVDVEPPKSE